MTDLLSGGSQLMIDLSLPQGTFQALTGGGYRLCLFKAVVCDLAGGQPLLWAATTAYRPSMTLTWTDDTYGYASTDECADNATVHAWDCTRIGVGQILDVGANAVTTVDPRPGHPRFVTATSGTTSPLSCGLAQRTPLGGPLPSPYCAFPLYGGTFVFLAPQPRVALAFTSLPLTPGSVVTHLPGPTVLADLGQSGGRVALAYDINSGWSWHGAQVASIGTGGLTDALIVPSD